MIQLHSNGEASKVAAGTGTKRLGLLLGCLLGLACLTHAQESESSIKAAFVYNFTKYVDWPAKAFPSPDSPIVIGVIGVDPVGSVLDSQVSGKTVGGRSIVVRHLHWGDDLSSLQLLFVPAGAVDGASALLRTQGRPLLIVGESSGFARRYGVINFVIDSGHVRFEINNAAAKARGLNLSSKLLTLGLPPQ